MNATANAEAERQEMLAQLAAAKANLAPSPNAAARKMRGNQLKKSVVNSKKLRAGDRSETVISFRGSEALKDRIAKQKELCRANGERINEWLARVIEDALDAEEKRK